MTKKLGRLTKSRLVHKSILCGLAVTSLSSAICADIVLDDFSSGVVAVNHPEGAGVDGTWYDSTNSTYGTPAADSLDGSDAMRITDGGFANGVYVVYSGVVPADGEYRISADIAVDETGAPTGFSTYQVGVAVGPDAQHRALNPSSVGPLAIVGNYSGLTAGDDTANPVEIVETGTFTASAGDSILIAFGTDVQSGAWSAGSSSWSGNSVLVDNIILEEVISAPPTGDVVIENFDNGVAAQNNPTGGTEYSIWMDTTPSTYGTPSASTLDGSTAMRVTDGGYANGVYAIYEGAIPADGAYQIEILMDVDESAGGANGIQAYSVGVSTGAEAVHRDAAGNLSAATNTGTYIGLTSGDDTANPTQVVSTQTFFASAGDDVLISLGTDVESGTSGANSGLWSGSFMTVDSIVLKPIEVEPPPFELVLDNGDGPLVYSSLGSWASTGSGYNGNDQYAASQNPNTATWMGSVPEDGFYEVAVQYRSGTNRASVASYEITTANGVETATVDQRVNNLTWVILGEYELSAGLFSVTLDAGASEPAGAVVLADAVRVRELPGPPPIDDPEMRVAIFLVFDPNFDDVGTIQNYVNDAARKHYNAIAVHARFRGDATYYPNLNDSTFPNNEPRSTFAGTTDVLGEFVTRGQAAGLKVFAYVNTNLVTDGSDTDSRPDHVLNQHPEWATYEWNNGSPVVQNTSEDPDGIWLDPGVPEVRLYNANICADIVQNYDVDGIFIDRQRYPDTRYDRTEGDFGYHPIAVSEFNRLYDKSGVPDPFDLDWQQFRRDQNTKAMQLIYSTISGVDPDALLLAYPIGRFTDAVNFNYQDWPTWMDNQVVDAVFPQIYTSSTSEFVARSTEQRAAYSGDRLLGVALDSFRPDVDLDTQIDISRQLAYSGQSPFHHTAAGPLGYFEDLAIAWDGIAEFPATPWKAETVQCDGFDIIGDEFDNLLVGTACDELIIAGNGADEVIASGGVDEIVPDAANQNCVSFSCLFSSRSDISDIVDGGEGEDTIDYSNIQFPIRVDLTAEVAKAQIPILLNDIGNDVVINIENIVGRDGGGDHYVGTDGPNKIWSNSLNATTTSSLGEFIDGKGGDDYIDAGGAGINGIGTTILGGDGDDIIHANDGKNQVLNGGAGNDVINAYGGRDFITGGAGDDIIDGGSDDENRAYFSGSVDDYTVTEYSDGLVIITDNVGTDGTDTLTNISRLVFSDKNVKKKHWAKKIQGYTFVD